ncbi:hypothetical protein Q7P36_007106 [Cladosporium allicinum]
MYSRHCGNMLRRPLGSIPIQGNTQADAAELPQCTTNVASSPLLRPARPYIDYAYALLAFYEMTVSSDWEDTTWRTHVDAYLVMLRRRPWVPTDKSRESSLAQALQFADDNDKRQLSLSDPGKPDSEMAELLLDVCKLRLSNIAQDLARLFERGPQPRKLDIQKLRLSVKRVYSDLLFVPGLTSSESKPTESFLIEHAAVQILAASLLIEFAEYLYPAETFHSTREYAGLTSTISLASLAIRKFVSDLLPATRIVGRATVVNGSGGGRLHIPSIADTASVIWPLFIVHAARNQEQTMRDWAGQTLYRVGQEARVPRALHLATTSAGGLGVLVHLSDTLAGLILASAMQ